MFIYLLKDGPHTNSGLVVVSIIKSYIGQLLAADSNVDCVVLVA
jgi:hypothetical protein